jgi:hypothetical protein
MDTVSNLHNQTTKRISEGMLPGGYAKLKETYPKNLAATEKALEDNFTEEGIAKYEAAIIKGLKKVDLWKN